MKGGFAQKLSNELDLVVVAPSENVQVTPYSDGTFTDRVGDGGVYNIYYKGVLMESFDGNTKPLFDNPEKTIEKYKTMYENWLNENTLDEINVSPENTSDEIIDTPEN